jgi:hypothetical protein
MEIKSFTRIKILYMRNTKTKINRIYNLLDSIGIKMNNKQHLKMSWSKMDRDLDIMRYSFNKIKEISLK